jgi:hypothetical protein
LEGGAALVGVEEEAPLGCSGKRKKRRSSGGEA